MSHFCALLPPHLPPPVASPHAPAMWPTEGGQRTACTAQHRVPLSRSPTTEGAHWEGQVSTSISNMNGQHLVVKPCRLADGMPACMLAAELAANGCVFNTCTPRPEMPGMPWFLYSPKDAEVCCPFSETRGCREQKCLISRICAPPPHNV